MTTASPPEWTSEPSPQRPPRDLVPAIRASLNAKLERLLARPLVARIGGPVSGAPLSAGDGEGADFFRQIELAARDVEPERSAWRVDPQSDECSVRIVIDYLDLWRGREKEILELVKGTIESSVVFLTEDQRTLLERSPREFLALAPGPETAELVSFEQENVGGSPRVVALQIAEAPESTRHLRHVAIVPNLFQLERQLDALQALLAASNDGPLAPLRALVGLCEASALRAAQAEQTVSLLAGEKLDPFQSECVRKALTTPHFAVIQGPPGSGKTTVISGIVRRALARGDRVLVVSPTHVAVDNVVEKLAPREGAEGPDRLEEHTLPLRYAARTGKLSELALAYWVGSKKQHRAATLSRRVERSLIAAVPFAAALYAKEDTRSPGRAPLSAAVAAVQPVLCGTPIGILSCDAVKSAPPGTFDLLIVDEVSKMTLPEFLAIAVKAKRWVLVGDPQQLPPFNSCEENAVTLDDVVSPDLEVVCSVSAMLEAERPFERQFARIVVVSAAPARVARALQAQLSSVFPDTVLAVSTLPESSHGGVVVCSPGEVGDACALLGAAVARDRMHSPEQAGTVRLLVERGVKVPRPAFASGVALVEERRRAQASIFATSFDVYHTQPWSCAMGHSLQAVAERRGLDKLLPSIAALESLALDPGSDVDAAATRRALLVQVAERFAVNAVSVYDWLTGIQGELFDVSPLRELAVLSPVAVCDAVTPFVGTLKQQYRMHPSLSRVPRAWFYFGNALHDGKASDKAPLNRVSLKQVDPPARVTDGGESNEAEAEAICAILERLNALEAADQRRPGIMVITPYRRQEALLERTIGALRDKGSITHLDVEVCTLDRCQGREAEYVFISLVRSRATRFMDMPKRWNVALTRAMAGLFIIGDVEAYLQSARKPQHAPARRAPPTSLIARLLAAYAGQIAELRR